MIHFVALFLFLPSAQEPADAATPIPINPADDARETPDFVEVSSEVGIAELVADRVSCGDFDGDGDPDLWVGGHLLRNDSTPGNIRLTEVTDAWGLSGLGGGGALWADLNHDRRLDLVLHDGRVLLQGKESFAPHAGLGVRPPGGAPASLTLFDLDQDGWLDLFTAGNESEQGYASPSLWRNQNGKRFRNSSNRLVEPRPRCGRSAVACDFDGDGDQDLYCGNYRLQPNDLWRNQNGRLERVDLGCAGIRDNHMFQHEINGVLVDYGFHFGHTIAAAWGDLDNDGWFDLWVSNLVHKYVGEVSEDFARKIGTKFDVRGYLCDDSKIYLNQGPPQFNFVDARASFGLATLPIGGDDVYAGDELWSSAILADFNNDGHLDAWVHQVYGFLDYSHGVLYMREPEGFVERHAEVGISLWGGYGGAAMDLDSDGAVDLVLCGTPVANRDPIRLHIFHNLRTDGEWIGFHLDNGKAATAVGAEVRIETDRDVLIRQVVTATSAHTQQGEARLHFGLGHRRIERVLVKWADGRMQDLGRPEAGRYHTVVKASGGLPKLVGVTPSRVTVGEEVEFRVRGARQVEVAWDFLGDRRPEIVGPDAVLLHRFTTPGSQTLGVRLIDRRGRGIEGRFAVEVLPASLQEPDSPGR